MILTFPFERGPTYSIGALRAFERELSAARANEALSNAWRVPSTSEMQRWSKIREETYPIKLLADHKAYPDDATFQLKPFAFPAVDAEISSGTERFSLQITIAHPVRAREYDKVQHGGYDNRLLLEGLNRHGVMHGCGPFRRDGDNVVCDDPAKEGSEPADACRKGLVAALTRKAKHNSQVAARLLVYARRYRDEVGDDFAAIVAEAMREFERACGAVAHFEVVYFVNTSALVEA